MDSRLTFNLLDDNFVGQPSSCGKEPRVVRWDRTGQSPAPVFRTDRAVFGAPTGRTEFAWLLEPPANAPDLYANIMHVADRYLAIFTCVQRLIDARPDKFRYAHAPGGIWIAQPAIRPKSKMLSMITSPKAWLPGHRKRLEWAARLEGKADVFGLTSRIPCKEIGLDDYRFSIAIENSEEPGYFTEKILDCFATGTVPVYWGCPDLDRFFDVRGVIRLTDDFDPATLTPERYEAMLPYVRVNLARAMPYEIPEDWIARTYFAAR